MNGQPLGHGRCIADPPAPRRLQAACRATSREPVTHGQLRVVRNAPWPSRPPTATGKLAEVAAGRAGEVEAVASRRCRIWRPVPIVKHSGDGYKPTGTVTDRTVNSRWTSLSFLELSSRDHPTTGGVRAVVACRGLPSFRVWLPTHLPPVPGSQLRTVSDSLVQSGTNGN